jgi:hypothetical protein
MTETLKSVIPATDAVTFNFECPLAMTDAETRIKTLILSLRRTDIEFFWITEEKRRFYLTTRNLRTHLIEADGFLTKVDDQRTLVSGEIHSDPIMSALVALIMLVILSVVLAVVMTGSLLAIVLGVVILGLAALYYADAQRRTRESQVQLAKLIQQALSST